MSDPQRMFFINTHGSELVTLIDGKTPFFANAVVGVKQTDWPFDVVVHLGVQQGRPVVNKSTIERSHERRLTCSNPRCRFTSPRPPMVWELPPRDADVNREQMRAALIAPPDACLKCGKGTLVEVPWSTGPDGETFGGPEITPEALHNIKWGEVWGQAIAGVLSTAASVAGDTNPARAALSAITSRRRRRVDDERLIRVGEVVRKNPRTPALAVSQQFFISLRQASRLVARARHEGFVTDTPKEQP